MTNIERPHGYQGGYLIGFIIIGVVTLRSVLFYQGQPALSGVYILVTIYALCYSLELWLSSRLHWHKIFYFPLQTAVVMALSATRPFLDFHTVLFFPLCIQIFRSLSPRAALCWTTGFVILLAVTLIPGIGLGAGLALLLLNLAMGTFLISYDFLYLRTQADQAESKRLLANLEAAHQQLQAQAAQADQLAAARERNRLARELHDSVSQVIFSIRLTSQSARLLLDRDPARVSVEIGRLQEMTSSALTQLRSLIAELRPH